MARATNITISNVNKLGKKLNSEQMIRLFKKKLEKSNLMQDMRSREYYVSPSLKRRLKSKNARLRVAKDEAKKAARAAKFENDKFGK